MDQQDHAALYRAEGLRVLGVEEPFFASKRTMTPSCGLGMALVHHLCTGKNDLSDPEMNASYDSTSGSAS